MEYHQIKEENSGDEDGAISSDGVPYFAYVEIKKENCDEIDIVKNEFEEFATPKTKKEIDIVDFEQIAASKPKKMITDQMKTMWEENIFCTINDKELQDVHIPSSSSSSHKKRIRDKNFCIYCEKAVGNFARHISRQHQLETDVKEILSKPKLSIERQRLLSALRKKGNYLENINKCVKPMKKPTRNFDSDKYLPCTVCLGFYTKNELWRHRKKCEPIEGRKRRFHQADAQNTLLPQHKYDKHLKESVFPRMRADNISFVAKSDPLICAFGAHYFKSHRKKHFINLTSRKMRELAKLLIQLRKQRPSISTLFSALQPQHYDQIIQATKHVANYDMENVISFSPPAYATNIAVSLKKCCNIATTLTLKNIEIIPSILSVEIESNLKTMIHLIDNKWRYDISIQKTSGLNLNICNKISLIPLASDLLILKDFLVKTAAFASEKLLLNPTDEYSYSTLLETVFVRVVLLNRRRPSELQRLTLPLHIYENEGSVVNDNNEEFVNFPSVLENLLIKKFKRIVNKVGKKHKVLVLFSVDVQEDVDTLIKFRKNFVPSSSRYLFARQNSANPLQSYEVVENYAKKSGAKNPDAITYTKSRKYLATLYQLINMDSNDKEHLASFMGQSLNVDEKTYRLTNDIYQTAKLSKLLILIEEGKADLYKGKSFDEIDLDLEEDEEECNFLMDKTNMNNPSHPSRKTLRYKRELVRWTDEQKGVVLSFFENHIKQKIAPKKQECEKILKDYEGTFQNKSWQKIKVFVQNQYYKKIK